jgi:hypothetical protein
MGEGGGTGEEGLGEGRNSTGALCIGFILKFVPIKGMDEMFV